LNVKSLKRAQYQKPENYHKLDLLESFSFVKIKYILCNSTNI